MSRKAEDALRRLRAMGTWSGGVSKPTTSVTVEELEALRKLCDAIPGDGGWEALDGRDLFDLTTLRNAAMKARAGR